MFLKISPTKSRIFTTMVELLSSIVDEMNIDFNNNKMYIQTMDSSRISLFEMTLDSNWFEEYNVTKNICAGVKLSIIHKILNCRDNSQSISIEIDDEDIDKINISLTDGDNSFDKYYETTLYNFDYEHLAVPEVDGDAEFSINSIVVFKLFDQLKKFGENVKFKCGQEKIILNTSDSEDFTGMKVTIPEEDILEYSVIEDDVEVEYSIDPLHKAFAIARLSKDPSITNDFKISVSIESPIVIEFDMFENSSIKFWIAPKMILDD